MQVGVAALVLGVADPIWPSDCLISIQHLGRERRNSQTLVNKYDKNQTFGMLIKQNWQRNAGRFLMQRLDGKLLAVLVAHTHSMESISFLRFFL